MVTGFKGAFMKTWAFILIMLDFFTLGYWLRTWLDNERVSIFGVVCSVIGAVSLIWYISQ